MHFRYAFIVVVVVCLSSIGHCFKNGYSNDTCDDMIPNHEPGEPNVTVSSQKCPYAVVVKSGKYRRNGELEVEIQGDEGVKGFQLQFRKSESSKIERVGEFVSTPDTVKFLQCDEGKNTAVTHKDLEAKQDLKLKWRAPMEDKGDIILKSSFVSRDKYWIDCTKVILQCADFPVSIQDCGVNKSCIRSSSSRDCDGYTCSYLLTYHKPDERTVKFSLSGLSKEQNSYTAVGFRIEKEESVILIVCSRLDDVIDVKYFILDKRKGFFEDTADLKDEFTDGEGNNFWCEFSMPAIGAGNSPLRFEGDINWIYAWGEMNKTTKQPIVNNSTWHEATHNISELINLSFQTDGSNSISVAGFIPIFLSLLSMIILQM